MVKVTFTNAEREYETEMPAEDLWFIHEHRPPLDLDGFGWKITEIRYHVDSGRFMVWVEKE